MRTHRFFSNLAVLNVFHHEGKRKSKKLIQQTRLFLFYLVD